MDCKSNDRQTQYLEDLTKNSLAILEEIRYIRNMLVCNETNLPSVGFTEKNREVSPRDRSCQTSDDDGRKDRRNTYH